MTEEREHGSATRAIVAKAVRDGAFREFLLRDTRGAVEQELQVELPDRITIHVHENSGNDIHIVLPPPLELSTQRPLSDEELQAVAGSPMLSKPMDTWGMCTDTWC
jgi:hypothetical protein